MVSVQTRGEGHRAWEREVSYSCRQQMVLDDNSGAVHPGSVNNPMSPGTGPRGGSCPHAKR